MFEPLGRKIRQMRLQLGLTLDELSGRTAISKPYLSLIETERVLNPPSDEKIRRIETALGFPAGELLSQAHLQRTPKDVRAMLQKLLMNQNESGQLGEAIDPSDIARQMMISIMPTPARRLPGKGAGTPITSSAAEAPVDLDHAYLSGVLQDFVDRTAGNVEAVGTNAVPVINCVSAGYPSDFTDLSYPRGVADDYIGCPDVFDKDAFAARVHGDSMTPKYREGDIVVFSPAKIPGNGDDCFIRFESGQTTFKRVFFESSDGGAAMIRLQPRNEKYRPQTLTAEQVTGIYKAVYRYQSVNED